VGDDHEVRQFATYAPCAISLIGKLHGTLHDRSIVIDLKRRLPSETVTKFRAKHAGHLDDLARKIARWAGDRPVEIGAAEPAMPDGLHDRAEDNWEPLLAIADAAGGEWPGRARKAALATIKANDLDAESRITLLLGDIKAIFGEKDVARISSGDLVEALVAIEGRPWGEYGKSGRPLSQNQLAHLLSPLAVAPTVNKVGGKAARSYRLDQFAEPFERYLLSQGGDEPLRRNPCDEIGTSCTSRGVTAASVVTNRECMKSNNDWQSYAVTVQNGGLCECAQRDSAAVAHAPPGEGPAPSGHVCAQCGAEPDGHEQPCPIAGSVVWLHAECYQFYRGVS
jgi:putative DNA primase/helicase